MGLDMYMNSVPKVDSIEELRELETRLSEAYFADALESELNVIQMSRKLIWPIPFTIEQYPETKEKYEEYKKADGHSTKIDIQVRVAYWRKFNALHSWFVKHVQKGVDNCNEFIVTVKHLEKLEKALKEITPENAGKKLPTKSGFFFGGTDYDEYYWADIEDAKATIGYLLRQINHRERTLIYRSSW